MSDNDPGFGWREWVTMTAAVVSALGWIGTATWQGAQEQDQWERNARQAAYAEFYGALQSEYDRRIRCENGGVTPKANMDIINEAMLGVRLYGSQETYEAAVEARSVISDLECAGFADISARIEPGNAIEEVVSEMRDDLSIG